MKTLGRVLAMGTTLALALACSAGVARGAEARLQATISLDPDTGVQCGTRVRISVTVQNAGDARSAPGTMRVNFRMASATESLAIPAIPPGGTHTVAFPTPYTVCAEGAVGGFFFAYLDQGGGFVKLLGRRALGVQCCTVGAPEPLPQTVHRPVTLQPARPRRETPGRP